MSTISTSSPAAFACPSAHSAISVGSRLGPLLVDLRARPLAHGHELFHRRRPLGVAGHERELLALLGEQLRELRAGGGLARSLEPGHQDHRRARAGEGEVAARAAHQRGELLVDDLHDLLAGIEALQHALADAALADLRGELLDDLEVDVGLEQGEPDLAHGAIDVCLAQLAARANAGERVLKAIGELVEHQGGFSLRASRAPYSRYERS